MEMTKEKIIEGNVLIAKFMNLKNEISDLYYVPEFGYYFNSFGSIEYNEVFRSNHLKYSSSLDWLMPVIDKIRNSNFIISIHASPNRFGCEIAPTKQFIIDIKKPFPFFELNSETLSLPMVIFQCITKFLTSLNEIKNINIDLKSIVLDDIKILSDEQRELMNRFNIKTAHDFLVRFQNSTIGRYCQSEESMLILQTREFLYRHCERFHNFNIMLLFNQTIE